MAAQVDKYAPKLLLKILRGQDLVAMDHYGVTAKSDPYCVVKCEGKILGKTQTVCNTLNPVFPSPQFFEVRTWGRVTIEIWDWDLTSADDSMGEASFCVRDVEMSHRAKGFNAVEWLKVLPKKDSDTHKASGWLQILTLFEDELPRVPVAAATTVSSHASPPTSSTTPPPSPTSSTTPARRGEAMSKKANKEMGSARTPVVLNYYDLGHSTSISNFNKISPYGAFHVALEMYETEFSFGGTKRDVTGVFASRPRRCAMHSYKGSIYLGDCAMKKPQIEALLRKLRLDWRGPHYDILSRNCCLFCREFAILLGVGEIPQWTYRLADLGASLRGATSVVASTRDVLGDVQAGDDINAVLIEHIMAVRMQRQFRARRARKAAGLPTPKDTTDFARKQQGNNVVQEATVFSLRAAGAAEEEHDDYDDDDSGDQGDDPRLLRVPRREGLHSIDSDDTAGASPRPQQPE